MLSHSVHGDKWVCPSDRHLLLRAKLNSGWSVRTSSNGLLASSVTNHETEQIKQVIKRAHCLDSTEQKRIGAMIHGLEEMRKKCSGDGVSTCILCAEEFKKFVGVSPITCRDCRKKVCSKCSVGCNSATGYQESTDKLNPGMLCKICGEGREVWKRSGAWFFRTLPRFILPEPQLAQTSRYVTSSVMTSKEDTSASLLPSGERFNQRRSLSRRRSSSSDSSDCDLTVNEKTSNGARSNDENSVTHKVPLCFSGAPTADMNEPPHNPSGVKIPKFREYSGPLLPPEICCQVTTTPLNDGNNMGFCPNPGPGDLGYLSFTLRYDKNKAALVVTIVCAKELKSKDLNGYSDAYVKIQLVPGTKKMAKLRTKTKNKTLNPEFNETLVYRGMEESDLINKKLRLQVWDEDRFRHDDFLGEVTVNLRHLVANETKSFTSLLTPKRRKVPRRLKNKNERLLLSLRFDEQNSFLLVNPVKCEGLLSVARANSGDLQVKICFNLSSDVTVGDVILESTDWKQVKGLCAEFDVVLGFPIAGGIQELWRCSLMVTLWSKDRSGKEAVVGSLSLSGDGEEDLSVHWNRCIETPGAMIEMWHQLTSIKQRQTSL